MGQREKTGISRCYWSKLKVSRDATQTPKCMHTDSDARSRAQAGSWSQAQNLKVNTVGVVELLFMRRLLRICVFVFERQAHALASLCGETGNKQQ